VSAGTASEALKRGQREKDILLSATRNPRIGDESWNSFRLSGIVDRFITQVTAKISVELYPICKVL
jgi:hypothetical protein